MQKALFLDRDGVINVEKNYLYRIEDIVFIDGIFELCRAAIQSGYCLIIVTNQAGIARGYYSESQFHELMDWVRLQFANRNIPIKDIFFCPHHPVHGKGKYKIDCQCRKPHPQMLYQAARKHNLDLKKSIIVGDKVSDIQAGKAVQVITTALVGTGHDVSEQDAQTADLFAATLFELQNQLFPSASEACA